MASNNEDTQSQTERERLHNEELAKNPPVPGVHSDTSAVQNLSNSLANAYPEADVDPASDSAPKDADSKPSSKSNSKPKK